MKFFIDTADLSEIRPLASSGLLDGVTTNPTMIAKSGAKLTSVVAQICEIISGPVNAEVTGIEYDQIMAEARVLRRIADNVCIKVPLTPDGLRACRHLSNEGTMVTVTLCFSAAQALLAAKSGASFISPFVGRMDDAGWDGMQLISDIVEIYNNYDFRTEVLVASVRGPNHVIEAAKMGAHVATLPPDVLRSMFYHPMTESGLTAFLADWAKTGQTIA